MAGELTMRNVECRFCYSYMRNNYNNQLDSNCPLWHVLRRIKEASQAR